MALIALGGSPVRGQQPADPAESGFPATGPLSGYMDFHFNKADGEDGVLDFHRFVLLLSHAFSSRIRFVGELELEHAFVEGLEEAGEIELEQAYVDFLLSRRVQRPRRDDPVPVGIINERHEPPVFQRRRASVRRHRHRSDDVVRRRRRRARASSARGWRYRAYVAAPLNSLEFNAEEGIRGGRQKGSEANVRNLAYTGRLEYLGVRGLTLGASVWTGESSFETPRLDTTVTVGEFDARYRRDRLELRGQFAHVGISDAGAAQRQHRAQRRRVAEHRQGAAGILRRGRLSGLERGAPRDLVAFVALRELRHAVQDAGRAPCR